MASKTGDHKQHAGRKLVDIAQKARGRTPFKYELEVIPFFAGEAGGQHYKPRMVATCPMWCGCCLKEHQQMLPRVNTAVEPVAGCSNISDLLLHMTHRRAALWAGKGLICLGAWGKAVSNRCRSCEPPYTCSFLEAVPETGEK